MHTRVIIALVALLIMPGQRAFAQNRTSDTISIKISDTTKLEVADTSMANVSDTTDSQTKNYEQLILEMHQKLDEMQLKLDQMHGTIQKKGSTLDTDKKRETQFYWSIQFGFMLQNTEYITKGAGEEEKEKLGKRFSYAIKPSIGYNFTDRITAGLRFVFADCNFSGMESTTSLQYMIANALIGGGVSLSDYITWRIQPYFRYRITKIIWDRLNLWGELEIYIGQNIPRDTETRKLQYSETSTIYGAGLRPMISVDINKNLMLFTRMDFISWNDSYLESNGEIYHNSSFNFHVIPIYNILSAFFNIGIQKKF